MITIKDIVKIIYARFTIIWGERHTARFIDEKYIQIWIADWCDGLNGIDVLTIKNAIDQCKINLEWPPTLAEFLKICEQSLNIPGPEECIKLAIRREFNHPMVKLIFDKIGSWDLSHSNERDLLIRAKKYHKEELENIRLANMPKQKSIENPTLKLVHNSEDATHGSDAATDKPRFNGLRKAEEYILSK